MSDVIDKEQDEVTNSKSKFHEEFKYTPPPKPPEGSNVNLNDFLNPRSMITPGVGGSLVMLIANTLWLQFMIPQKWSAIILSFLLIVPILIRFSAKLFENVIYFVFNGLIVFALAVNTNFVGTKLQSISGVVVEASASHQPIHVAIKNALTTTDRPDSMSQTHYLKLAAEDNDSSDSKSKIDQDKKEKQKEDANQKKGDKKDRKFFQQWF